MKTKIFFTIAASAVMFGMTSCSDFLTEDNKVGETAELSYSTPNGLEGLVADCYTFARGWYGKEAGLGLSEMGTDLFYYGYDNKQKSLCSYTFTSASLGNGNTADNPCLDDYWELFYCATDVCNNAIKYVGDATFLSATTKNQYLGETHFLRAFYYFHLVNIWGDVPYFDTPTTAQVFKPVRMAENKVYGKILEDIDKSIAYFDEAGYKTKEDGRANYWAARALKARVLLYAASWISEQLGLQIEGNDEYASMSTAQLYAAAKTEAEAVIGASDYASFYTNYADVWSMNNESYNTNKEALFGITYSQDLKTTVNCLPKRYRLSGGSPMDYNSLITRTGYSRGGSAMLLMFVPMWNNGADDFGGSGTGHDKNGNITEKDKTRIFIRSLADATSYLPSSETGEDIFVADKYSPYGRGFTRYLPSLRLWQLLDSRKATDQRYEATLLTHYDVASPKLYKNAKNYPEMQQDTAIFYAMVDGNSAEGEAMQAWAKNKYRIQFAAGGDIPVYTSMDPATALPTEKAKNPSDVYGDKRYNSYKIGGWCSFPGIKKFLDNVYDPTYRTHDISSRDAIVMRLPEMYLIKAEAELKTGGDALSTINELRSKRAISGQDNTTNEAASIDLILEERAIEFCGEQMRWFDLKRTGKLYEYINKYNAQASGAISGDATGKKFLYRPIPQSEMDAIQNPGEFKQNPGW